MNVLLIDRASYKKAIENLIALVNDKKVPSHLDLLPVKRLAEYYRPNKKETQYLASIYDSLAIWCGLYSEFELLSLSESFIQVALDIIPIHKTNLQDRTMNAAIAQNELENQAKLIEEGLQDYPDAKAVNMALKIIHALDTQLWETANNTFDFIHDNAASLRPSTIVELILNITATLDTM